MEVKIGELKDNLSRYLRRVSETGEPVTILDRDKPVARIVALPQKPGPISSWAGERERLSHRSSKLGVKLRLTAREPKGLHEVAPKPSRPPDRRTDIETVARLRSEKDY